MRAYDIAMLLLCINIGIAVVGQLDMFPEASHVEAEGTETFSVSDLVSDSGKMGILIGFEAAAIIGTAYITRSMKPVAIMVFSSVFWTSYFHTEALLEGLDWSMHPLAWAIRLLTAFVFVIAAVQMASGVTARAAA